MKIVHVVSEMYPYIKTGGLADMVGSLARVLADRGHEVSVFLPGYRSVLEHPEVAPHLRRTHRLRIEMGDMFMSGDVREFSPAPNLRVFLICREEFFDRKLPYGNGERDYEDNHHRFIFFCKGVVEVLRLAQIEADVVHSHDWPAGLLPLLLRAEEERRRFTLAIRTIHTIHNLAFQGLFPLRSFYRTNLPEDLAGIDGVEFYGQGNMMKAGILFADRVTTVSPRYAQEIQTAEFGCGLEGVVQLRTDDLTGMLNGIDTRVWNPATDPLLPGNYSAADLGGKKLCRAELLKAHGFDPQFKGAVFGVVARLTEQKGIHLLLDNEAFWQRENVKLIVRGEGDRTLEARLRELTETLPQKVAFSTGVDERASHLITAGADFFLMPSLFEPCGLNQMYAQAYGTVPVVAQVGGLMDTVLDVDADPARGTGIMTLPTAAGVLAGLERSLKLFADRKAMRRIQATGMAADFSWARAAKTYESYYDEQV